ncbi:cbb3-type cytochrome c oxidase subunit 3 [bacterium]|nr:cbb3-type cytochrome c oxidase subunit 3 [bacterium]
MDLNTLRGLSTVFAMAAFFGICWWAYSGRRKKDFEQAANLPFADENEEGDLNE